MLLRSGFPFNYDQESASDESGLRCEDVSLAKQSFAEEVDINTIVRRFGISGQLPENVAAPTYSDFNDVFDFKSAMDAIAVANEAFDQMPANVRSRFQNDPQEFVEFCSKEENRAEAVKLGLIVPEVLPPAPVATGAAAPPAVVEPPVVAPGTVVT